VLLSLIVGMVLLLVAHVFSRTVKDLLHPAVVFPAIWGVTITAIGLAEPFGYYQISPVVLLIFVLGISSFIAGALFGKRRAIHKKNILLYNLDFKKIAWFCIAFHAVMLPLSFAEVNRITGGAGDIFAAAYRLRAASISGDEKLGVVVGNYLLTGLFFVPVMLIGWMQKQIRSPILLVVCIPWILLNIFIGGRSSLIILIFASAYVYISLNNKIPFKAVVVFAIAFVSILIVGNLLVDKIDAHIEDGIWPIIQQSATSFFDYFLQGPILFSEYYERPNLIKPTWDALVFPCHLLEKINLCKVPPLHQEFTRFSNRAEVGNVYSLFFSIFPKYGWLGVVLICGGYGFWASFHHARRYKLIFHMLIGAFLFSAALLSIFSDTFGPSSYYFFKILIISSVVSYVFKKKQNTSFNARR
jgi:oligosaccharide repeat unit polymerase